MVPVLMMFQASVAAEFLAPFFVNAEAKKVLPLTVSLMVYSTLRNFFASACRLSITFSETVSNSGSFSLAESKSCNGLLNIIQWKLPYLFTVNVFSYLLR